MLLESAYVSLQSASASLKERTANDNGSRTVTKGRVIAAVLVVLFMVLLEVVFDYFRKKKIADRRAGKNRKKSKSKSDINDLIR